VSHHGRLLVAIVVIDGDIIYSWSLSPHWVLCEDGSVSLWCALWCLLLLEVLHQRIKAVLALIERYLRILINLGQLEAGYVLFIIALVVNYSHQIVV
jgi:hypothetical protein